MSLLDFSKFTDIKFFFKKPSNYYNIFELDKDQLKSKKKYFIKFFYF